MSLLAETLVRIDGISGYLRDHGLIDPTTGEVRTVVEVEGSYVARPPITPRRWVSPRARAKISMET